MKVRIRDEQTATEHTVKRPQLIRMKLDSYDICHESVQCNCFASFDPNVVSAVEFTFQDSYEIEQLIHMLTMMRGYVEQNSGYRRSDS